MGEVTISSRTSHPRERFNANSTLCETSAGQKTLARSVSSTANNRRSPNESSRSGPARGTLREQPLDLFMLTVQERHDVRSDPCYAATTSVPSFDGLADAGCPSDAGVVDGSTVTVTKTASRQVFDYMNDTALNAPYGIAGHGWLLVLVAWRAAVCLIGSRVTARCTVR